MGEGAGGVGESEYLAGLTPLQVLGFGHGGGEAVHAGGEVGGEGGLDLREIDGGVVTG